MTRPVPVETPLIQRVQSTATGATDGNIIAAIISTHSPRKTGSARPMVPGPLPMLRACATVIAQRRSGHSDQGDPRQGQLGGAGGLWDGPGEGGLPSLVSQDGSLISLRSGSL